MPKILNEGKNNDKVLIRTNTINNKIDTKDNITLMCAHIVNFVIPNSYSMGL